jgi:hypothetical protein
VISRTVPLQIAFWGALVVAVVMATLPHPPHTPLDQFGDKVEHMTAFGVMAVLAATSYPRATLLRIGERLSFLGALIEVVQSIPALHRDCDIMDWVADTAAITAVLLLVAVIRRRKR